MSLRGPVLAATSLSPESDEALRQAQALAASLHTELCVCHVLPEAYRVRVLFPHQAGIDTAAQAELEKKARGAVTTRVQALLGSSAGKARIVIESGTAHAGILEVAERIHAGAIVVGPGATAHRVARAAGRPVLVARDSPRQGPVCAATDFSDPALPALHEATDEAARRGVPLRVVHCLDIDPAPYLASASVAGVVALPPWPQDAIDQLKADAASRLHQALDAAGASGEVTVVERPPATGIVEHAAESAAGLVVVGTHGRTGFRRLAIGSVAEDVLSHAPCSVMVVPLHPPS